MPQPIALAGAFGLLYLTIARLTRSRASPGAPWLVSGLKWAGLWFVAGVAFHVVAGAMAHPSTLTDHADWGRGLGSVTPLSLALTLAAVLWEELWFRNPVLNLVRGRSARIVFAAVNGLLFAALHVLNPKFDLLVGGPEVFAAGVFLTLVYFASGSFYAALALHLGNNLASTVVRSSLSEEHMALFASPETSIVRTALLGAGCVVVSVAWLARPEGSTTA